MGGTSNALIGEPWNGLGLCHQCHAWAESRRDTARLLGWLTPAPHPTAPFWTHPWGWLVWVLLDDDPPCWCVTPTHTTDPHRLAAVEIYQARRSTR